ncbi:lysophospholipid acyltransferase family protein [Williamsia deligens]|uniref:Lysophospholipid acyltransferase family protein n=1 Tax=Williamsia deligens TaxID=321325 RepID=A0ABW3G2J7_9NOCA|nr:lysophospholipid acyltransferase family protein [Williamsia deligens]MCP2195032.1 1-acyl-sn-glycerol-3-phosphate acyltransferases [Williamsia deligens]
MTDHAWFPTSSCDASCVREPASDPVGPLGVACRVARFTVTAGAVVAAGTPVSLLPRPVRRRFLRGSARSLLASLGITVEVDDRRPQVGRGVGLVVANHTTFLDIVAIACVVPARFVAKSEVLGWPVVGDLARRLGVIGIDRRSLRSLPATVAAMTEGLFADDAVGVFPEGTTWCGHAGGRFRPAAFQAAVDAQMPVIPVHVGFRDADGAVATVSAFIGDDDLMDTVRRILRTRGLSVVVRVHELQLPADDRRELTRRCERLVFGDLVSDDSLAAIPTIPAPVRPIRSAAGAPSAGQVPAGAA